MTAKRELCSYRSAALTKNNSNIRPCKEVVVQGSMFCELHRTERLAATFALQQDKVATYRSLRWRGPLSGWSRGNG